MAERKEDYSMANLRNLHGTSEVYEDLKKRKDELISIIAQIQNRLKDVPEGDIVISSRNDEVWYYLRTDKKEKTGTYIRKSNQKIIEILLQKKYDMKILKLAKEELHDIEKILKKHETVDYSIPYVSLPSGARKFISPIEVDDQTYIKNWRSIPYISKGFHEDDKTDFYTQNNERVRSKSEILIADALKSTGIPYVYEFPIKLKNGRVIHPDFKILNIRTRETYYWEHLGKMDDSEYVNTNLQRLKDMRSVGIVQGVNLILSFETLENSLSTRDIQFIINTFLK